MATDLHAVRTDYTGEALGAIEQRDPWELFDEWMREAIEAKLPEPNGMTLSTVRADGRPASRVVLLKEYSQGGLVFFTHYDSAKGDEIEAQGVASALFYWIEPMRQIRATGTVTRLDDEASERYFRSRPRASQISAWVSRQSRPLVSREHLEAELAEAEERFAGEDVPMPDTWGGYVIGVEEFEFWQGMAGRVHDRARFIRDIDGWHGERLYP